ncbi:MULTISPECIES: NUDIX hydrolase [Psychrilyobacter]|uniref:NUDIX domain-containing protein n=1 Tax=Psychrilyobacter piezotolerans TaxID=2293438 RepID=A0ABX9KDX6_9FUSO|nr:MULTISPECIES: NUDIX domain-containing protein [Psychrilyobacter]MCS5421941.1 NUDIX domain-containing protein [Psychrilyobacter sp. S5]NDI78959.1 NUDIX domain-containing protein [Psychrilyobacter piezotolerans]RDE59251.1 NUDIX domain-containing protein [Psychrilyobacter sp. S5]REI39811.1 NUDIX domain-containing protein [Psychrilyobacter piezotolerans]
MRILRKVTLENTKLEGKKIYKRIAARGIILDGENILLLYTKRYDDYSFPGGGVDQGENLIEGVKREINEETGAKNIEILAEYGVYDEMKPIHKKNYDYVNMTSHFFICDIHKELGETNLEDYEINNGMDARWVNIYEAIAHNKEVIKNQPETIGLFIDRELFMLELVAKELIEKN